MISKVVALAAATMALLGSAAPMGPTFATPLQDARLSAPAQPAPLRNTVQTNTGARDEVDRVDEIRLFVHRHRRQWDGKNRTSGDRAHKRMKRRRASGRR